MEHGAVVEHSVVGPLLRELEAIAGRIDSERAATDQALISELRREIAELQAAVAHLRAGSASLPGKLRPAVARAMTAVQLAFGPPG